ncbi:MAG: hypothetical protein Fur005_12180 [Roseiflexaceae bacterium]
MDLLQILILLTITGICGAIAMLIPGFTPPGVVPLLFALITGTIGTAIGGWFKALLILPDLMALKIGTIRIDLIYALLGSLLVVGVLMALQSGLSWVMSPNTSRR